MQPLEYAGTPAGIVWICICVVMGFAMTALAYLIINRIPAAWLCDYNETPSEELLSGKRIRYLPTGPVVSVLISAALVMCRLQFNRGFDIMFVMMALIMMCCLLIAISDLKYQIIPDQFTIALAVLSLILGIYDIVRGFGIFHHAWWSPLAGAAIGAAAMIGIDLLAMVVYHREGMGFGDVKLFAAIGLLTGFPGTIYTLIISILTATVFFVAIILVSRILSGGAEQAPEDDTEAVAAQSGDEKDKVPEKDKNAEASDGASEKDEKAEASDGASEKDKNAEASDGASEKDENAEASDDASEKEQTDDSSSGDNNQGGTGAPQEKGFGSYLAFGPYIAAALIVYIAFYDQIAALVGMYLDLFR